MTLGVANDGSAHFVCYLGLYLERIRYVRPEEVAEGETVIIKWISTMPTGYLFGSILAQNEHRIIIDSP